MTISEVQRIDDENHLVAFAVIQAPEHRLATDSPTVCPEAIYLSPRGWIAYFPGGMGDPQASLETLLRESAIDPAWVLRPQDLESKTRQ